MTIGTSTAKDAIHDKLESQLKTAQAKLDTLKARAEVSKANVEIKAIADLAAQKLEIHQKLHELKKAGDDKWEHAKKDLEARIAAFEKSVKGIDSKVKTL
jgi:multidrug efflux pump subunit AcrA (membrane-fusion protein)